MEASVTVDVPLEPAGRTHRHATWRDALHGRARLRVPDARFVELYDAAVATLVLCTPDDAWAGPYTYKRYWYRDAVFVGHGLLCAGRVDRARHLVHRFPQRQGPTGYYHSQEGEWDANGEVLWLAERLERFGAKPLDESLWSSLVAGADWIVRKRLPDRGGQPHEGLLPAGFSAEHLGPNDHYYWDDYWGVAGLRAAARLARRRDRDERADAWDTAADAFAAAIERSLGHACRRLGREALPAAPTRRLDAGAIGSLVASYPLGLCAPDDARLAGTLEFLLERCFHEGGFFQDMIHSGVNAYLTLHVAQCLLRAGDSRHAALVRRIAELASDRTLARGRASAHRRRLHGRRAPRVGGRRVDRGDVPLHAKLCCRRAQHDRHRPDAVGRTSRTRRNRTRYRDDRGALQGRRVRRGTGQGL